MSEQTILKKHFWKFYFAIIALSALLYFVIVGGAAVWSDEAYTFAVLKHSLPKMCSLIAHDVHPPLYYIVLKIFTCPFGYSLVSAKTVSIITYLIIIGFGGYHAKKLINEKTAIAYMLLFLFFPFTLRYSIEVRMYALAALFVLIAAVYAYKTYTESSIKNIILFSIATVCAAYTHYFALAAAGIVFLELLVMVIKNKREKLKQVLLSLAVMIVAYIPWVSPLIGQFTDKHENGFWIEEVSQKTLLEHWHGVFDCAGLPFFVWVSTAIFVIALIYVIVTKKNNNIKLAIASMIVPLGVYGFGIGISLAIQPIFVIRYFIPTLPLFILFLAIAISNVKGNIIYAVTLIIFIIAGSFNYVDRFNAEYNRSPESLTKAKLEKYDVDAYIENQANPTKYVLGYYDDKKPIYVVSKYTEEADPFNNIFLLDKMKNKVFDKVLLFQDVGTKVPNNFLEKYNAKFIGKQDVEGYWADTYILTRK